MGVYIKADGTTAELTQCSDPKYAVGYCKGKDGKCINYPEEIAQHGGTFASSDAKERKIALYALTYAKRRRERNILALQEEISNLNKAINLL